MKTVLMSIFILSCTQLYGQLVVDTRLSVKDSIIIVTLHNDSDYRIVLSNKIRVESLGGSEVKFLFIDTNGDTVRRDQYIYGEAKFLGFQPKETRKMRFYVFDKIDFTPLRFVKVCHSIDYYTRIDTTSSVVRGSASEYRDEVVLDIQKILHPSFKKKRSECD